MVKEFTDSYYERFNNIMNSKIDKSLLISNSKLLYNKELKNLNEIELFDVRRYSLGYNKFLQSHL